MHLHRAEATILGLIEALTDTPGVTSIGFAGLPPQRESIGDPISSRRGGRRPALIERFTRLGLIDQVLNKGGYKAAVRVLRGPQVDLDGDAAGSRRHVPHPLHRIEGAQRPSPRARPGHGLEPVREGFPAHR